MATPGPPDVYSRNLTLQAHFTFGTTTMAPVQYAHLTPTSTSALGGRPLMASGTTHEHWRWNDGAGGGAAQCSITCGREGVTMTYNAQPAAHAHHQGAPCPVCSSVGGRPAPPPATVTRSLMDLSRPQEQPAARSLTFSGSLDRATQRPVQQRPYGRRCKSTAHIVLQNNEARGQQRPHEFHNTLREGDAPPPEGRGRAPHRATEPGGEQQQGAGPPLVPCCHHCSALYCLVSSLAQERPCPACVAPHHHHHHHHHQPHHHHHQPPAPHHHPPPDGDEGRQQPKSPTVRTFNSHRCYEEEGGAPPRRHRTPSPRMMVRGPRSPPSSPSPDRRGDGAEDRHPQPRRVPRMGAAAAAAAAAAAGVQVCPTVYTSPILVNQ